MRLCVPALLAVLFLTAQCPAADPKPFPGAPTKWEGFARHDFKVDGTDATVVVPDKPLPGRPWVWRGEFFGAFADADIALVKAGWHQATIQAEIKNHISRMTMPGVVCFYIDDMAKILAPCPQNCGPALAALQYWLPNVVFLLAGGKNGKMELAFPYIPQGDTGNFNMSHSWSGISGK